MDMLGIIGTFHLIIFLVYIETISVRLNKKIRKRHVVYYVAAWTAGIFVAFSLLALFMIEGFDYFSFGFQVMFIGISLLILDFATLTICSYLYRKFPFFRRQLGHDVLREKWIKKRMKKWRM